MACPARPRAEPNSARIADGSQRRATVDTTEWAISIEFDTESALTASQLDALSDLGDPENVTIARRASGGRTLLNTAGSDGRSM
jgi:hypothetical protein